MPTDTTVVKPTAPLFDEARLAIAGFLARYSGSTRTSYATDLRQFFTWCAQCDLEVFAAQRGHVELYARTMEERGLARATIGRRLSPWPASTASPSSTGRSSTRRRVRPLTQDRPQIGHPRPYGAGRVHRLG